MTLCSFHIYTIYSDDGAMRLSVLHEMAKHHGISALCITDHNSIDGAVRFQKKFSDLQTVVGEEIFTNQGEIIGLFLSRFIPPGMSIDDTIQSIRDQGGLVCLPHPCDAQRPSSLRGEALEYAASKADIIEVFNSRSLLNASNRDALALCTRKKLIPIWGADAHYPEEVGQVVFAMEPFSDASTFLAALRRARPLVQRATTIQLRVRIRLNRLWGIYGPLRLPEKLFLAMERILFNTTGGGYVSLDTVNGMCRELARKVTSTGFAPDLVIGIAGGGLYPAYQVACHLEVPCDFMRISYPQVRLGNMDTDDMMGAIFVRNLLKGNDPQLHHCHQFDCKNKQVLLVDDDCTSGRTLRMATQLLQSDAEEIRTLTLRVLAKSDPCPDFFFEDLTGSVFRHARFPWIKHSPDYPLFARFRDRWL
jgi:predicted metal-dependent phosphoesterase TrpH/hypoxanthine phosphoribosyltransferase